MLVFAGIVPHPPIVVPEIGKNESERVVKTRIAMEKLMRELSDTEPDTIIFISPHMVHFPHLFNICGMDRLFASFASYEDNDFEWHGKNNLILAENIFDKSEENDLPAILMNNGDVEYELDHSIAVPLYFAARELDFSYKILPVGTASATRGEHYSFGQIISEVLDKTDQRVAVIVSGDLSHQLNHGKVGKNNEGAVFDRMFMENIKKGDDFLVMNMDEELVGRAGQCVFEPTVVLLGILSGKNFNPQIHSYEGPFGVGYMVANMNLLT